MKKPKSLSAESVLESAAARTIEALGYTHDPHLVDSPKRIARFLAEWHTVGKPTPKLTTFPNVEKYDELVMVGSLPVYSLCAHHGLPFFGKASVGYIPQNKILGLSKFARVIDHFAHRYQTQERLSSQVAKFLQRELRPIAVGVVLECEHLCMSMRGVSKPGHRTVTSVMLGQFRDSIGARNELLALQR